MNHAELFLQYRSLLFGIAYRMLGSLDAEDIVQDTFLQFQKLDLATIVNPRGLLITIVTRRCIDLLKSARVQREQYVGTWLPEPLPTGDLLETISQKETLSMAFMLMLETLTPVERAVFLLRDVFDLDYAEIADTIDKSPQNCRQIAHRARINIDRKQTRYEMSMEQKVRLLQQFLVACNGRDLDSLIRLLAADCKFYSDGGGKATAALKPIFGCDRVISFLSNVMKQLPPDLQVIAIELNGEPSVILQTGNLVAQTLTVRIRDGKIAEIYAIRNPDKLDRLSL
ncbi:RNA polymerase sigma-70 factor [Chamaesiphon polymorphus]|uniref:RNA polymerase sigma-70 factor n=1 Tax=Chamaesiphon polymorphus CCALA 037 TaxID=2107692 RepID=A0A2T1GFB3_9CYAN|nr:RNA polymerase sigma-70 factor [Chamaesiphon polymorphus]PSB56189.1 RNA polymerase sigma-70 factor [Chamaesiphon polymorphus CCALA 037]